LADPDFDEESKETIFYTLFVDDPLHKIVRNIHHYDEKTLSKTSFHDYSHFYEWYSSVKEKKTNVDAISTATHAIK